MRYCGNTTENNIMLDSRLCKVNSDSPKPWKHLAGKEGIIRSEICYAPEPCDFFVVVEFPDGNLVALDIFFITLLPEYGDNYEDE